jgi:hypothetical protein
MLVLWVWIGVVVFAAVVFAFCAYELVWKSRRLQDDLEKLNGLSTTLASLQSEVTITQERLAKVQFGSEAGA